MRDDKDLRIQEYIWCKNYTIMSSVSTPMPPIYIRNVNTITDAYKNYFQRNTKTLHVEVQITQDNKVVVFHDNVAGKRLKNLRNIHKSLVTLEEYLKHTPDDIDYMIDILRYDDKDFLYRVVHICEQCKPKKAFIYVSDDKKFCKHVKSMRRRYLYKMYFASQHDSLFNSVLVHKDIMNDIHPQLLSIDGTPVYDSIFVYGVNEDEQKMLGSHYPWVHGWLVDSSH